MASKKKRTPKTQNGRWVIIAPDSVIHAQKHDSDPDFVSLRNPSTDEPSLYVLGSGDVQLYEVKAFQEDFHSWFVGQSVQRDGKLIFVTPMDPLFMILSYLMKYDREGKFQPVDQVVKDEDFPACARLLSCMHSPDALSHIADEKEVGSLKFYRYSSERTMYWLQRKVERIVAVLKKKNICVGEGMKSSTYNRVNSESEPRDEDYLRYAHGLISEYISEDLSKALLKHLGLPEPQSPKPSEPPSKKRKLSDKPVEAGEDYTKFNSADFARKPPKKMTAAQKTLAKVDKSGMKPMSSFFSPKAKAEKK